MIIASNLTQISLWPVTLGLLQGLCPPLSRPIAAQGFCCKLASNWRRKTIRRTTAHLHPRLQIGGALGTTARAAAPA